MGALLRCVGGCRTLFLLAVLLDVFGLILIFIGIFANLRVDGRFYGDFLIYTGALVVFVSLACWLMWYVANVQVREAEEHAGKRSSLVRLARKLSERLSRSLQRGEGVKCVREEKEEKKEEEEEEGSSGHRSSSPPRKAGRVTWGRSTAYSNHGYDASLDETHHDTGRQEEA